MARLMAWLSRKQSAVMKGYFGMRRFDDIFLLWVLSGAATAGFACSSESTPSSGGLDGTSTLNDTRVHSNPSSSSTTTTLGGSGGKSSTLGKGGAGNTSVPNTRSSGSTGGTHATASASTTKATQASGGAAVTNTSTSGTVPGTNGPTGTVGRSVGQSGPYEWKHAAIVGGGYVPAVVFSPIEPDLIYLRTDMGGAYRWDPANSSWLPLTDWVGFDEWNYLGIESIAADPKDASRVYLAVGTYTNSWTSLNGQVLRSSDRGDSFERFNLPFKLGGNMPGRSMGERLAIDPNATSTLYLGARSGNGLWRSEDSGETWKKVESFPSGGDYFQDATNDYTQDLIGVVWVVFDPSSSTNGSACKTLYVGVADTKVGIYRSLDGGATWSALEGQPTDGFLPHHATLTKEGVLYVTYSDKAGPYDGGRGDVWRYDTKAGAWALISPVPSSNTNDNYFGYGGLAVDAQDPNTLVVSSLNSWWPDARFYRSRDAGATWSPIWDFAGYPTRVNRYELDISVAPWLDWGITKTAPEESPKLGWMTGSLAMDPFDSDRMLYGTGATLYGTTKLSQWDDTAHTIPISVFARGIEETAVLDLVAPPTGPVLLSALGDVGGYAHTDLGIVPSKIFLQPTFTSTNSIDFAENDPKQVIRVGTVDSGAYPNDKTIGVSNDGGLTWSNAGLPIEGASGGTIAMGSDAEFIVWAPGVADMGVYYAQYSPHSWSASTGIPSQAQVRSDRVNKAKFYGFKDGTFYVSSDGGKNFSASPANGLPKRVAKFKAVPGIEGDLWLAGGSTDEGDVYGLWHSTDSGATFEKLANVQQADVVGFGKAAPNQTYPALYVSAKIDDVRGIYRSDDAGGTFVRINDDQHQYGCTNSVISGDPNVYGRVYVGTNGRGVVYGEPR